MTNFDNFRIPKYAFGPDIVDSPVFKEIQKYKKSSAYKQIQKYMESPAYKLVKEYMNSPAHKQSIEFARSVPHLAANEYTASKFDKDLKQLRSFEPVSKSTMRSIGQRQRESELALYQNGHFKPTNIYTSELGLSLIHI